MLSILRRKHVAKWGLIILTSVIIFAFVFWGSNSMLRDRNSQAPLGRIFGRPVRLEDYQDAVLAVRTLALLRYGDSFTEVADYLDLEAQAWERLILLEETRRRRIRVSDDEVIARIQGFPFFQENGTFDQRRYDQLTAYAFGTPARAFEEQMRQTMKISKLYDEITASVVLSEEELRQEYDKQNTQISVAYLAAFPPSFAEGITPDDTQLKNYYAENSVSFKEPLSFQVSYLSSPLKERMEQAYEQLKKNPSDMQAIAKESGLVFKETEFFGEDDPIPGIGWDRRVNKMLAQTEAGQISVPFSDGKDTYYLIRVDKRREPSIPEFDSIKDTVKEYFIQTESVRRARERIEQAYAELQQSDPAERSLQRTAQKFGLAYDVTDPFNFQSYIEGIGSSNPFWLAARAIEKPQTSTVINTPAGFFVVWPQDKTPFDEETFQEGKEKFEEAVLSAKKEERFAVFLRSLSQAALQ